jgi:hypothetical protein
MLQTEKAGARDEEDNNPAGSADDSQFRTEKFRRTKAQQDAGKEIGRGTDQEITDASGDRADWSEKIMPRVGRRSDVERREPSWNFLRNVGDQRKEEERPGSEKNQGVDFIPCMLLSALFRHRGS